MSEARDTVIVFANTLESNCTGCTVAAGPEEEEGFVNPDCLANMTARNEKGLPISNACGRILMQYATDTDHHQVFNGKVITMELTRTLRRVDVEPIGGRWELLERDYEARGHSSLIIDLETDSSR